MIGAGQIVLFAFPRVDQVAGKLRPALILRALPGKHGDWLICMISSQLHQAISGMDEMVQSSDHDFRETGLKTTSVIRVTRLAVVSHDVLQGAIGTLSGTRVDAIRLRLAVWIAGVPITQNT